MIYILTTDELIKVGYTQRVCENSAQMLERVLEHERSRGHVRLQWLANGSESRERILIASARDVLGEPVEGREWFPGPVDLWTSVAERYDNRIGNPYRTHTPGSLEILAAMAVNDAHRLQVAADSRAEGWKRQVDTVRRLQSALFRISKQCEGVAGFAEAAATGRAL